MSVSVAGCYSTKNILDKKRCEDRDLQFYRDVLQPVKRHSHTEGVAVAKIEENYFSRLESV